MRPSKNKSENYKKNKSQFRDFTYQNRSDSDLCQMGFKVLMACNFCPIFKCYNGRFKG